jgi:hypothetical protein
MAFLFIAIPEYLKIWNICEEKSVTGKEVLTAVERFWHPAAGTGVPAGETVFR